MTNSVHTTVYKELIQRFVAVRNAAGLTQQAVADQLGKHQSYVAKVEGLERRVEIVELLQLAKAIGFDPMPVLRTAWTAIRRDGGE